MSTKNIQLKDFPDVGNEALRIPNFFAVSELKKSLFHSQISHSLRFIFFVLRRKMTHKIHATLKEEINLEKIRKYEIYKMKMIHFFMNNVKIML